MPAQTYPLPVGNLRLTVAGVDWTNYLLAGSLRIQKITGSQVDTCNFSIKSPEYYRAPTSFAYKSQLFLDAPQVGQTVIVELRQTQTASYRRIFGGQVQRVSEERVAYKTVAWAVTCSDWTGFLSRTTVTALYSGTASDVIRQVLRTAAPFITASGVQNTQIPVGTETGKAITFERQYPADIIDQIAKTIGYEWYVDEYKNLLFYDPALTTRISPNTLTDTSNNFSQLSIQPQLDQVRNRIYVTGGTAISDWIQETWTADGLRRNFPLRHSPIYAQLTVSGNTPFMTINGIAQYVGLEGQPEEVFPFIFSQSPNANVNTSSHRDTVADLAHIVFTYRTPFPVNIMREDIESQRVVSLLEGTDYDTIVGADSPLFWWKMDARFRTAQDDAGLAASVLPAGASKMLVSGYVEAQVVTSLAARPDAAMRFNEQGFLYSQSGVQLPRQAYTIEAWVAPDSYNPPEGLYAGIAGGIKFNAAAGQAAGGAALAMTPSGCYALLHAGAVPSQWILSSASPTGGLMMDHVVGVWTGTGGTARLYVNSQLVGLTNSAVTAPIEIKGSGLQIGTINYEDFFFTRRFGGLIDEVAIYNYALSEQQIQTHYASGTLAGVREYVVNETDIGSLKQARDVADFQLRRWSNVITRIQFVSRQHNWQIGDTVPVSFTESGIGRSFSGNALIQQVDITTLGNSQMEYRVTCEASRFNMLDFQRQLMRPPKIVRGEATLLQLIRNREDKVLLVDWGVKPTAFWPLVDPAGDSLQGHIGACTSFFVTDEVTPGGGGGGTVNYGVIGFSEMMV